MNLQQKITEKMKEAMKTKNILALESLRAIKSEILLAQTKEGASSELSEEEEITLLQKLVKQRKESASIYKNKGRDDLALPELAQVEIIAQFLPEQISNEELLKIIAAIMEKVGATSIKDMGKVMGIASKQLAGRADGKAISEVIKQLLK